MRFVCSLRLLFWMVLSIVVMGGGNVHGAGFALFEQSVSGLGNAFAGAGATADDPSTIYANPAGMTKLAGDQITLGGPIILPHAEFKDRGSTVSPAIPVAGGTPLTGGGDKEAALDGILPNLYYSSAVASRWWAGIGVNAPFGLGTEYDKDWAGRYHAVKSEAVVLNINPAVAFKINNRVSVGAGINMQYFDAELSNAIDFGLLGFGVVPGFMPQGQDGFVKMEADDWGYGFNLGVLFEPWPATRLGVSFRSKIDYTLRGKADFSYPDAQTAALASSPQLNLVDQDAESDLTVPESFAISMYHEFSPQWAIMGDIIWTRWSRMKELRVTFDGGAPDAVDTLDWEDSWHYSLGLTYRPAPQWILRTGVSYDETAISSARLRTPRMPGEDRLRVAFGVGYRVNNWLSVDLAYSHTFSDDAEIDRTGLLPEDFARGALNGVYDLSAEVIAVQVKILW